MVSCASALFIYILLSSIAYCLTFATSMALLIAYRFKAGRIYAFFSDMFLKSAIALLVIYAGFAIAVRLFSWMPYGCPLWMMSYFFHNNTLSMIALLFGATSIVLYFLIAQSYHLEHRRWVPLVLISNIIAHAARLGVSYIISALFERFTL